MNFVNLVTSLLPNTSSANHHSLHNDVNAVVNNLQRLSGVISVSELPIDAIDGYMYTIPNVGVFKRNGSGWSLFEVHNANHIESIVRDSSGVLLSFVADGVAFTLEYEYSKLVKVSNDFYEIILSHSENGLSSISVNVF